MSEDFDQAAIWIRGCTEWIEEHVKYGWWVPYYINFMFEPLPGSPSAVVSQMHKAVRKFYGQFCTRFVHNPRAESEQDRLPRLWLFPDKPTWKRRSTISVHDVKFNDNGLHFNGPMLLPRFSRFRGCPIQHFEEKQTKYARGGIRRIHIEPMNNMRTLSDYAAKTIKWGRADEADILVLPRSVSEIRSTVKQLSPTEKAIKDIQAATNVCHQIAETILSQRLNHGRPGPVLHRYDRDTYKAVT